MKRFDSIDSRLTKNFIERNFFNWFEKYEFWYILENEVININSLKNETIIVTLARYEYLDSEIENSVVVYSYHRELNKEELEELKNALQQIDLKFDNNGECDFIHYTQLKKELEDEKYETSKTY